MTDNQTQKDRIKFFASFLNLSIKAFEEKCGLSNGYISSIRKGVGHKAIEQISDKYPNLNTGWLLTGEGEMLKGTNPINIPENKSIDKREPVPAYVFDILIEKDRQSSMLVESNKILAESNKVMAEQLQILIKQHESILESLKNEIHDIKK